MAIDVTPDTYAPGDAVEVFNSYRQSWVGGFEVARAAGGRYALRRIPDWAVLPGTFDASALRPPATSRR
jgi:nitrogen fixation protein